MTKILKIQNGHLSLLPKVLKYPMPFAQGRMVNRFLRLVSIEVEELEKNRIELCNKLCLKDENEQPILKDERYQFPEDTTFYKELDDLFSEACKIDFPQSMLSDIDGIKNLMELSTVKLEPQECLWLEVIIESFNNMEVIPETPSEPIEPESPESPELV